MNSVPAKLTLRYVLVFVVTSALILLVFELALRFFLLTRVDDMLATRARRYLDLASRRKARILQSTFERDAGYERHGDFFARLVSADGDELAAYSGAGFADLRAQLGKERPEELSPWTPSAGTVQTPGGPMIRVLFLRDDDGKICYVGKLMAGDLELLRLYRVIAGAGLAASIILGGILNYLSIRRVVERVDHVQKAAMTIGKGNLDSRVALEGNGDEIDELALAFNEMLDRVAKALDELEQLSSNVAHDLRRPIARIRGHAELAATGDDDTSRLKEEAGLVVEECDRMDSVVATMLEISRAEGGVAHFGRERIDVVQLLCEGVALFAPLAEEKDVELSLSPSMDRPSFEGDKSALQRVMANLLDNAIKYTGRKGRVTVTCNTVQSEIRIEVSDTGIGISGEDLPRIFDRFFRCEKSRSLEGSGLGLSLARALARAQGGNITVVSAPSAGSTFTVRLPSAIRPEKIS